MKEPGEKKEPDEKKEPGEKKEPDEKERQRRDTYPGFPIWRKFKRDATIKRGLVIF